VQNESEIPVRVAKITAMQAVAVALIMGIAGVATPIVIARFSTPARDALQEITSPGHDDAAPVAKPDEGSTKPPVQVDKGAASHQNAPPVNAQPAPHDGTTREQQNLSQTSATVTRIEKEHESASALAEAKRELAASQREVANANARNEQLVRERDRLQSELNRASVASKREVADARNEQLARERDRLQAELNHARAEDTQRQNATQALQARFDAISRELSSAKADAKAAADRYRDLLRDKTPPATSGVAVASTFVTIRGSGPNCQENARKALMALGVADIGPNTSGMSGEIKGYIASVRCFTQFNAVEFLVVGADGDLAEQWKEELDRAFRSQLSN
jgi:NADH dehydrogenase/NADH:ubiquinone oxidoreductase subunit G